MHESVWRGEGQNRWQMDGVVAKVKGVRLLSQRYSAVILLTATHQRIQRQSQEKVRLVGLTLVQIIYIFPNHAVPPSTRAQHVNVDRAVPTLASLATMDAIQEAL